MHVGTGLTRSAFMGHQQQSHQLQNEAQVHVNRASDAAGQGDKHRSEHDEQAVGGLQLAGASGQDTEQPGRRADRRRRVRRQQREELEPGAPCASRQDAACSAAQQRPHLATQIAIAE